MDAKALIDANGEGDANGAYSRIQNMEVPILQYQAELGYFCGRTN